MKGLASPSWEGFKVKPSQQTPSLVLFVCYASWRGPGLGLVVWGKWRQGRGRSEGWVADTASVLADFLEEAAGSSWVLRPFQQRWGRLGSYQRRSLPQASPPPVGLPASGPGPGE